MISRSLMFRVSQVLYSEEGRICSGGLAYSIHSVHKLFLPIQFNALCGILCMFKLLV